MTDPSTDDSLRSDKTLTKIIFSLAAAIIGMVSTSVAIGWFVLIADAIWVSCRLVVGAIRLSENRPVAEGKYGLEA